MVETGDIENPYDNKPLQTEQPNPALRCFALDQSDDGDKGAIIRTPLAAQTTVLPSVPFHKTQSQQKRK